MKKYIIAFSLALPCIIFLLVLGLRVEFAKTYQHGYEQGTFDTVNYLKFQNNTDHVTLPSMAFRQVLIEENPSIQSPEEMKEYYRRQCKINGWSYDF